MRTTHIVARFMTLGTSVSPAPRRAPAATIDAPKSGSASSSILSTCAESSRTAGSGVSMANSSGHMNIIISPNTPIMVAPMPMHMLP